MQAQFIHDGDVIDYTPAADVAAGEVVIQMGLVGIAIGPIPANTPGSLARQGLFAVAKATSAGSGFAVGATVYWDAGGNVASNTSEGGKPLLGIAVAAAADNASTVNVVL